MSDLKVGDVVFLNSENEVKMTVAYLSVGEVQCIYYNPSEHKFVITMAMPEEAVTRVPNPGEDIYR